MEKKKYDIFISYSRKDIDKVLPIVKEIESKGISVWFDIDGIESGDEFVTKIATAIDNSDSVLFMYTENSVNGQWTQKEVMYAKEQKKIVIPILLDGSMPDKGWFKFLYGTINCIDITNNLQKEKLYKELNNKYGEKISLSIKEENDISTEQKVLENHKEVGIHLNFFRSHKTGCALTISVLVVFCVILIPSAIFIDENDDVCYSPSIKMECTSPNIDSYEIKAIDLALPSRTLWGDANVGAKTRNDYGVLYAWGETSSKNDYSENYYDAKRIAKHINIVGLPSFDAATHYNTQWQLPTISQFVELVEKCLWTWENRNGVNGYLVTGSNGNTIFLPAAGWSNSLNPSYVGVYGYYWTGERIADSYAKQLLFSKGEIKVGNGYLYYGRCIRPVMKK